MRIGQLLIVVTLVSASLLSGMVGLGLSSAVQYTSYTYDAWGQAVPAPEAYLPIRVVHGFDLGLTAFSDPQDLFVADDNTIYLADSGNNRIVHMDAQFHVLRVIQQFDNQGQPDRFAYPQGLFVTPAGDILIADRDNERIVWLDSEGALVKIIAEPDPGIAELFPEFFRFRPRQIVMDPVERIFVIVEGLFEGLMELNTDGEFRGYIGAPRVAPTVADLFWSRIASSEQRERMALVLPTEYSNMALDGRGFLYTTVSGGALRETHAVRRLTPAGQDVLRRTGTFPPIGDIHPVDEDSAIQGPSVFVDVAPRADGIYSVLDRRRGRVFSYDEFGNLLYVFGGPGQAQGLFMGPAALDVLHDTILVLDRRINRITVFEPTEYAQLIHGAIHYYNSGDYQRSTELWHEVLQRNTNYDIAYSRIGHTLLRQERYAAAMDYYRLGNDRAGYSDAFHRYRQDTVAEHFGTVATMLLMAGITLLLVVKTGALRWLQRQWRRTPLAVFLRSESLDRRPVLHFCRQTGRSLWYSTHVIFHPYDGFWDLKAEKRGTLPAALILVLLVIISYIYSKQYSGFIVNYTRVDSINILTEAVSVLLPFALWCLVNWAWTTLMDGKGTLRDICIASAYSLTPIVLLTIPAAVISNYLAAEEQALYTLLMSISVTWSLLLLFISLMITHDYDMAKSSITLGAIVVGMGTVLFVGLLFFSVIDRMVQFATHVYTELVFRL